MGPTILALVEFRDLLLAPRGKTRWSKPGRRWRDEVVAKDRQWAHSVSVAVGRFIPMSAPAGEVATSRFVLTQEAVREAISSLTGLVTHETFPLYLYLRRRAVTLNRFTDLQPEWSGEIHDWLDMPGGPPEKPYYRPFRSRGKSPDPLWVKDHLVGSYGISSLRENPLYTENDEFRLPVHRSGEPDPHPFRTQVLRQGPVPAWSVAAFLFRNNEFVSSTDEPPGWSELLEIFKGHFEWTQEEQDTLFLWDYPTSTVCFEEWQQ